MDIDEWTTETLRYLLALVLDPDVPNGCLASKSLNCYFFLLVVRKVRNTAAFKPIVTPFVVPIQISLK